MLTLLVINFFYQVQTYKKVLLLLLIICITGINQSCNKNAIPKNYPMKPGFFPITRTFREYRLKNSKFTCSHENTIKTKEDKENWKNVNSEQNSARVAHLKRQTNEVRKRMKNSLKESEKIRGKKTVYQQLYSLIKRENKAKK